MQQTLFGLPIVGRDPASSPRRAGQNRKLGKSGLTECFEIEGSRPCKYMAGVDNSQSPLCPGCWAAKLWKVRNANSRNRRNTPRRGLIRLGTWRETTYEDWRDFKAGRGQRQDGTPWERPDFPSRRYFVVTRGLEGLDFYRELAADPLCINIQVSVDIIKTEQTTVQIPDDRRLAALAGIAKAVFRFKPLGEDTRYRKVTYRANAEDFLDLRRRLGLATTRILETPLRLGRHSYGDVTPLERAGLDPASFLRCNSPCEGCGQGENRFLACAATERMLDRLAILGNSTPKRVAKAPDVPVDWRRVCKQALRNLGGSANLTALYAEVRRLDPAAERNPIWDVKVRQAVRRIALRIGPATWRLKALPVLSSGA